MKPVICRICQSPAEIAGRTLSYYDFAVDVYHCKNCDSKFIPIAASSPKFYDGLYSSGNLGYHRDETKDNLSLEELIYKDVSFAAVSDNLPPSGPPLNILDVGCGYGYLTNSLKQLGHRVKGIDISGRAITVAKELYGNYFEQKEITEVSGFYDMIIGIELIEHLPDPKGFVGKCAELLRPGGKLILTTPNKDFYNKSTVWMTNPYPVHLYWFGRKAMAALAESAGLNLKILPYHEYLAKYDNVNLLVDWLRYKNQKSAMLGSATVAKRSRLKSVLRTIALAEPIKMISNFIFSFRPVTRTLAVVMTKS